MPENNDKEIGYLSSLLNRLQNSFRQRTSEYNAIMKIAKNVNEQLEKSQGESVVLAGIKGLVFNRLNGISNVSELYKSAKEGVKWTYYFNSSPNLQNDVKAASYAAFKEIAFPEGGSSLLTPVKVVGASVIGFQQSDIQQIQNGTRQIVQHKTEVMAASTTFSFVISKLLKEVGKTATSEAGKVLAKSALRIWQVSGVLAVLQGFSGIHQSMQESGPFGNHLKFCRNVFLEGKKEEVKEISGQIKLIVDKIDLEIDPGL